MTLMCVRCNKRRATRKLRRITTVIYDWKHYCGYCANSIKERAENNYSVIYEEVIL